MTNEALHIEPGFWLNVPATKVPAGSATVVRQGSIPHGTSVLALGNALTVSSGPGIGPAFGAGGATPSTPVKNPPTPPALGFNNPALPPGFKPPFVGDLNLALKEAILGQDITQTVVLPISTAAPAAGPKTQVGGTVNMPFDVANADATRLDAIFWIETVQQPDGSTFLQLQYTQTVILHFLGIDWPHISVATLTLQ